MHKINFLQLFADGAGAGAGDGAGDPGVTTAAAEQTQADRLKELGVPEDKLKRKRYQQKQAAQPAETETTPDTQPKASMTWDEFMGIPENNKRMQDMMSKRVAKSKQAEADIESLTPALETLARNKYGIEEYSTEALIEAITDDDSLYEDKAVDLGVSTDVARKLEKLERMTAEQEKADEKAARQAELQKHFDALTHASEEVKSKYPQMDLQSELQNPMFVYGTAPNSPIDVEVMYRGIHFDELLNEAVQKAVNSLSKTAQVNLQRPRETLKGSNDASLGEIDWHNATKEQREAMRARIRREGKVPTGF